MTTYYIDPSAGVNGSGTELSPFNTWSSVTWTAGNTYLQKCGTTYSGKLTLSAANITIGYYGTGAQPIIDGATQTDCIDTGGYGGCSIDGYELKNSTQNGVKLWGNNSAVTNCVIHDIVGSATFHGGVLIPAASNNRSGYTITGNEIYNCRCGVTSNISALGYVYSNINISGNILRNNTDAGILLHASGATSYYDGVQISNNTINNNTGAGINVRHIDSTWPTYPTVFNLRIRIAFNSSYSNGGCGIYLRTATTGSIIVGNYVYGNSATSTLGGIWTGACNSIHISYNKVIDNLTNGIDGMGIFDDQLSQNNQIYGNFCSGHVSLPGVNAYDTGSVGIASYRATGSRIYGNICVGNITGITNFGDSGADNAEYYNNLCLNNLRNGIKLGGVGYIVKNNIGHGSGTYKDFYVGATTTVTDDYNCFGTSQFDNGGALGANSITSNPNLIGYELGANSPCIGTGTAIDVTDYNGERFTEGKQDMGAIRASQGMRPAGLKKSIIRQSKLQ